MKKIEIKGTIYAEKTFSNEFPLRFSFIHIDYNDKAWSEKWLLDKTKIAPYIIEIDAPDNLMDLYYNNTLNSLQIQRKLILAENEQRINNIDAKISELQAIENKG